MNFLMLSCVPNETEISRRKGCGKHVYDHLIWGHGAPSAG